MGYCPVSFFFCHGLWTISKKRLPGICVQIRPKKCILTATATGLCQVHLNIFQLVICVKCHTLFFANVSHSKKHLSKDFALTSTCSLTHVNISCKNQAPFLPKHEFCHLHLKAALRQSDQLQNSYKSHSCGGNCQIYNIHFNI